VVDAEVAKVGVMIEHLSSRFELVIEAISGIGGRIETLRDEMIEQFAEVGKQIRFLSEQIGENRDGLAALRSELTAEIVRLGEALGATRVEFRHQIAEAQTSLRREIIEHAQRGVDQVREEMAAGIGDLRKELCEEIAASTDQTRIEIRNEIAAAGRQTREESRVETSEMNDGLRTEMGDMSDGLRAQMSEMCDNLRAEMGEMREGLRAEMGETRIALQSEIADQTSALLKQVGGDIKQTQKSLAALSKKFDRFDDRVSVQVKDHEQKLRKVERHARG
jgi:uncharacterized coiled-coil protein SlyX